jgi:nicotinamide riboside transporter PnuC
MSTTQPRRSFRALTPLRLGFYLVFCVRIYGKYIYKREKKKEKKKRKRKRKEKKKKIKRKRKKEKRKEKNK